MPSYLGFYQEAATNRHHKLKRAINSFLHQKTSIPSELIIISDGCDETVELVNTFYKHHDNIKVHKIDKKPMFSGKPRTIGVQMAKYNWIIYLDSDDEILNNHINNIGNAIAHDNTIDWLYYDDIVDNKIQPRYPKLGKIGTSSIAHKKHLDIPVIWPDGYEHDWKFIQKLIHLPHKKINHAGYIIHHIPGRLDD